MDQIKFLVDNSADISSKDLINLRTFYSPIIGSLGVAFYQHLYDLYNINRLKKYDLAKTSEFLVMSINQIKDAKNKLEGLGLIKTLQDKDGTLLFKLIKPLCANGIVKNSLIANLLKNKLGEVLYNNLIKNNAFYYYDETEFNNVSKNFFEVFSSEKISLQQEDCFDFKIINEHELIEDLTSEEYISYHTRKELSPSQILMLKKIKSLNFKDNAINNIIKYSISINNAIICNYILKIANDFARRNLYDAYLIDNELCQASLNRNNSYSLFSKKYNNINDDLNDLLTWDD
ncbi:hypothetical protein [Mycoplasma sp. 2575]